MPFTLEQVVIPVGVLGEQPDLATFDDWLDYFDVRLVAMRDAMPCQFTVRLSLDVAERMYGETLPETDPGEMLTVLSQCGQDRHNLKVFLDRELSENTVRLQ